VGCTTGADCTPGTVCDPTTWRCNVPVE
jgi:hypothetical protein